MEPTIQGAARSPNDLRARLRFQHVPDGHSKVSKFQATVLHLAFVDVAQQRIQRINCIERHPGFFLKALKSPARANLQVAKLVAETNFIRANRSVQAGTPGKVLKRLFSLQNLRLVAAFSKVSMLPSNIAPKLFWQPRFCKINLPAISQTC